MGSRDIRSSRSDSGPLVATLGLELGILGEKPQALEGTGRFECPSRSAIRRAHFNPNNGTSSVGERRRASPGICGVQGAEDVGSRQDSRDYSAVTAIGGQKVDSSRFVSFTSPGLRVYFASSDSHPSSTSIAKTTIAQRERCEIRIQRKKMRTRNQPGLEPIVQCSVPRLGEDCAFRAMLSYPSSDILIRASQANVTLLVSAHIHVPSSVPKESEWTSQL
jgi:hypothetical protein